ncbi:carbohydrate sulfotransferase 1 [Acetobacter orientalis]|uniref:Carbohydrate sulfotransferase 1 n=1 Tax=Acetobacter orientalis TaxID=146474 RepID=A0A2Z5ZIB5_9PROT|nr:carbohydrate sulfotransferase 1 [Acetobacter orientalis]
MTLLLKRCRAETLYCHGYDMELPILHDETACKSVAKA